MALLLDNAGVTLLEDAGVTVLDNAGVMLLDDADVMVLDNAGLSLLDNAALDNAATPDPGVVTLTSQTPLVSADVGVAPAIAVGALVSYAPSVSAGHTANPTTGLLGATGDPPSISVGATVEPTAAALRIVGIASTVAGAVEALPGAASLAIIGHAPTATVIADRTLEPSAATLTLVGANPTFEANAPNDTDVGRLEARGQAPEPSADASVTAELAGLGIASDPPTASGGTDVSTVEIGAVEWTAQYLPVSQTIATGTGTIGAEGHAPDFQAHFAATANDSNLRLLGYKVLLFGDRDIAPGVGILRIVGYPPFILRIAPPARRDFRVNAQDRTAEVERIQLVPVGAQDRQMAVTGRRRVFRVGRRSGPDAA